MKVPLHQITEDQLILEINKYLRPNPSEVVGIGDDCAVLPDGSLLKTDSVIEGSHYTPDTPPELVGRKAIARVMSDFAAMGGLPEYFLVTCGLRTSTEMGYIEELYTGMDSLCSEHGGYIIGGETCSIPEGSPQFFSIMGYGKASLPVLRSGAMVGDLIYVTGKLGNTFHSGHHLHFTPRLTEAAWLVTHAHPNAMMDLSDGLARDLPRLARASNVGYHIHPERLPLQDGATTNSALSDGEDYELLFTIPTQKSNLIKTAPFPVTCIGEITQETAHPLDGGWDHLAQQTEI